VASVFVILVGFAILRDEPETWIQGQKCAILASLAAARQDTQPLCAGHSVVVPGR
jgi:hypothetical protein